MRPFRLLEPYLDRGLPRWLRDALAIGAVLGAILLGLSSIRVGSPDNGIHLYVGPDRVTIADISPWGDAARSSLRPGMVVLRFNEFQLSQVAGDPDQSPAPREAWASIVEEPMWALSAMPVEAYDQALADGSTPWAGSGLAMLTWTTRRTPA
jgi:hypothetical protein